MMYDRLLILVVVAIIMIIMNIFMFKCPWYIIATLARSLPYTPEKSNRKSRCFQVSTIHIHACYIAILYSSHINRNIFTIPHKIRTSTNTHTHFLHANQKNSNKPSSRRSSNVWIKASCAFFDRISKVKVVWSCAFVELHRWPGHSAKVLGLYIYL